MANIEAMVAAARSNGKLTLEQVRALVQGYVDTDLATIQAKHIEEKFLVGSTREQRVAVFLSGLVANLLPD